MKDAIHYALKTCGIKLAVDTSGYGEGGWIEGSSEFSDGDYEDLAEHIWWTLLVEKEVDHRDGWLLYRVVGPYFVAGILIDPVTKVVKESAPILRWTMGESLHAVEDWAVDGGKTVERV